MTEHTLLLNKYEIISELRKGWYSTTYLSNDKQTQEKYIIKHFNIEKNESKILSLVEREAKILKNVSHPQIPIFVDYFTLETESFIEIYLVQQYIEGKNIETLIKEGKYFTEKDVVKIAVQLTKILEYLHNFLPQIIHRDVKPSNIIITSDERVYLIDFGSVKEKLTYGKLSNSGLSTIIGTQGYMPIEQFEGKAVPGSDIYSLGLTLIYLLSHKEPLQIPKEGLYFKFQPFINVSEHFSKILQKMIEIDWTKRYITTYKLRSDLTLPEKIISKKRF